jgi:hypothetical protein
VQKNLTQLFGTALLNGDIRMQRAHSADRKQMRLRKGGE